MTRNYRTSLASRERNRIHARKTRQRKKEQMQNLQSRADELKGDQLRLRQIINEKNTANILLGLFKSAEEEQDTEDPRVEQLLRRPIQDIPDASQVPELPALILPGQHASKKIKTAMNGNELPSDGIDYDLLGKDRSKCTPEELDRIRRERNRMHAKRTRDRKRLFTEQMSEICRQLGEENQILTQHLSKVDPDFVFEPTVAPEEIESTSTSSSPKMLPQTAPQDLNHVSSTPSAIPSRSNNHHQLGALLQAVDAFEQPDFIVARNLIALSDDSSVEDDDSSTRPSKRRRTPHLMPTAAVGC